MKRFVTSKDKKMNLRADLVIGVGVSGNEVMLMTSTGDKLPYEDCKDLSEAKKRAVAVAEEIWND